MDVVDFNGFITLLHLHDYNLKNVKCNFMKKGSTVKKGYRAIKRFSLQR